MPCVDETGFHTDCSTMRPRAMLTGTVFVAPRFRRQGVAQRLVREAETHARLWGFSELMLPVDPKNAAAHRLYEKLGYVKIKGSGGEAKQVTLKRNLWAPNLHTVRHVQLPPRVFRPQPFVPHRLVQVHSITPYPLTRLPCLQVHSMLNRHTEVQ